MTDDAVLSFDHRALLRRMLTEHIGFTGDAHGEVLASDAIARSEEFEDSELPVYHALRPTWRAFPRTLRAARHEHPADPRGHHQGRVGDRSRRSPAPYRDRWRRAQGTAARSVPRRASGPPHAHGADYRPRWAWTRRGHRADGGPRDPAPATGRRGRAPGRHGVPRRRARPGADRLRATLTAADRTV